MAELPPRRQPPPTLPPLPADCDLHSDGKLHCDNTADAAMYKSTNYGPDYVLKEAKSAEANGGVGWLLWNPGCDYWAAWRAFPAVVTN